MLVFNKMDLVELEKMENRRRANFSDIYFVCCVYSFTKPSR